MINQYLLAFALSLSCIAASAQGFLRGVVIDKTTGEGVPLATVRVAGTSLSTSTTSDGTFRIQPVKDTVTIVVQALGFYDQRVKVRLGDEPVIRLKLACNIDQFSRAYIEFLLSSGVRNTPLGCQLSFSRPLGFAIDRTFAYPAVRMTLAYQAGRRNRYLNPTFHIDELVSSCGLDVDAEFQYQRIKLASRPFDFERRSAGFNVSLRNAWPIWLAVGRSRMEQQEFGRFYTGVEIGSEQSWRLGQRRYLQLQGRAGWWQTHWQWQGKLSTAFGWRYPAAVVYQQIGSQYREVVLQVGVKWDYRTQPKRE
ncbi:carboxypeptidase-like regulatory domain-containing protein [Solirubrum puertoriconensis]|uniref:carboxypeptidase-like regulatory domain-containing protein n=1 Tax=Solirubrum puertoriconensis TaxID=1751427 RepID=UPI00098EE63F|nr:carboxypeptidase-like regulatory domain-containing protein [Solirubrum puertoriconensis]